MDIGVVGCGKVGLPYLCWLIDEGFDARGFDVDPLVRRRISANLGPKSVVDTLDELTAAEWIHLSVPTDPTTPGGPLDTSILETCVWELSKKSSGARLRGFIQRSTCAPGTADRLADRIGEGLSYGVSPSFIRKATVTQDTAAPERLAFGGPPEVIEHLKEVHARQSPPRFVTTSRTIVEFLKFVENSLDSVLISYWNDVAATAALLDIAVPDFVSLLEHIGDRSKFAGSARVPGQAFGLWCLPKDLDAFIALAQDLGVSAPTLVGARATNEIVGESLGVGLEGGAKLFDMGTNSFEVRKQGVARIEGIWKAAGARRKNSSDHKLDRRVGNEEHSSE